MRKLLFFFVSMVLGAVVYAQSTATLQLSDTDVTNLEPNDKVYVTIRVPDISANQITGFQFFIYHDQSVITWDGTTSNPSPGINWINPEFPLSAGSMFNVNPSSQLVFLWGDGSTYASLNPGDSIIRLTFTYHGGQSALEWQTGPSGMENEMYDENFDYFALTLIDGCACMPNFDVTFHVTDSFTTANLEGANVTITGIGSVLTDINGNAVFSLANGDYDYLVTMTGYWDVAGSVTVSGAPVTVEVPMTDLNASFAVTFQVTDDSNIPLEDAEVQVGSSILTTNAAGEVVFNLLNGDYSFVASKYGYTPATDVFTVASAPMTIPVVLNYLPHYDVTFQVTNLQSQPVEGALVDIQGVGSMLTDINGEAVFSMIDGTYDYTVTKENYVGAGDSFTVASAPLIIPVSIAYLWQVTFHVTDGTINLAGAQVTVNGESKYTGADGNAVFHLIIGDYPYTVTKLNYEDVISNVSVVGGAPQTEEVVMTLVTYTVTFTVTDGTNPLAGAEVTVGSEVEITNASGIAIFELPNGFYDYTVVLSGYNDDAGNFEVAGADIAVPVVLEALFFDITFHVYAVGGANLANATVTVQGYPPHTTNTNGITVFGLMNGTYNWTVTKDGYNTETGSVTVTGADITVEVEMVVTLWTVTFHVYDSETLANLEGATITVIGYPPLTTNTNGIATILLPDGNYTYSVIMAGYESQVGQTFTVDGADLNVDVPMDIETWEVKFKCNLSGVGLADVMVTCNGETILTNANGEAFFYLPNGTYDYTIEKFCFNTITGQVTVNNANQTITKAMTYAPFPVILTCLHAGEPLAGVNVTLAGSSIITGDDGIAEFMKTNGTYTWTAEHDEYPMETGSVTVNCDTVSVTIIFVGINDVSDVSFSIYPNPSNGVFSITTDAVLGYSPEVSVFDFTGRMIYTGTFENKDVNILDLSAQEPGMYIMRINLDEKVYSKTLIIR